MTTDTPPKPRRLRRLIGLGIRVVLLVLVVGQVLYLTRRFWAEPLLLPRVTAALGDMIDADVTIQRIGGNWLDVIVLEGTSATPRETAEHPIGWEQGRVEVAISIGALLRGDWLSLTHGLRVYAEKATLTIPATTEPDPETATESTFAWPDETWDQLASTRIPEGVLIDVPQITIISSNGKLQGPLHVSLESAPTDHPAGTRRLQLVLADISASLVVTSTGPNPGMRVNLDAPRPARLAALAGVDLDVSQVTTKSGHFSARATLDRGLSLRSKVQLRDLAIDSQRIAQVTTSIERTSSGRWLAESLDVALGGGDGVRARDLGIDERALLDLDVDTLLTSLTGSLDLRLNDTRRFANLVPAAIATWLPRTGTLAIRAAADADGDRSRIVVDGGTLAWPDRGVVAELSAGQIPLRAEDAANGALDMVLRCEEAQTLVIAEREATLGGAVTARLRGAFDNLTIEADAELAEGHFDGHAWAAGTRAKASVRLREFAVESATFDASVLGATSKVVADAGLVMSAIDARLAGTLTIGDDARPQADIEIQAVERAIEGRRPIELTGDLALDGFVLSADSETGLRVRGPLEADQVLVTVDLQALTTTFRCDDWTVFPDRIAALLGTETPVSGSSVQGSLRAEGPLTHPDWNVTLDSVLPDGFAWLGQDAWPSDFGRRPEEPWNVTLRASRLQTTGIVIATASATLGDTVRIEAQGAVPVDWDGESLVAVPAASPDDALSGLVRLRVVDGSDFEEQPAEVAIHADFGWSGDGLRLEPLDVTSVFSGLTQSARGSAVIDGITAAITGQATFGEARVTGNFETDALDLAQIPRSLHGLPALAGTLRANVTLNGPLVLPVESGDIEIRAGRCKLPGVIPTIEGIELAVHADDRVLTIERASGTLGGGKLELSGEARATERWFRGSQGELDLRLRGENVLLARQTGLKARADLNLQLAGPLDAVLVAGEITMTSGTLIRRVSLLPDFKTRGGGSGSRGSEVLDIAIPEPLGSRLRYDLSLTTAEPFDLRMHVVEAPVSANFRLRGTGAAPILEGSASALGGTVRLPAMQMEISQALITANPARPGVPEVSILARGRRLGVDVQAQVEGPIDATEVTLSSTPALSQDALTVLLSTGRLPDDLRERGLQSQAALVGTYLAQELVDFYFGSDSAERDGSLTDRFRFESGREVSRNGVESITVEFNLREGFFLQAERDVYEDYNMGALYRFRF